MSLTRKQAREKGINRKEWKRSHKKWGRMKSKREHTKATQTPPEMTR